MALHFPPTKWMTERERGGREREGEVLKCIQFLSSIVLGSFVYYKQTNYLCYTKEKRIHMITHTHTHVHTHQEENSFRILSKGLAKYH